MLEVFEGPMARELAEHLRRGPIKIETLSKSGQNVAYRFLLHGLAFTKGHGTPAHPLELHLTARATEMLVALEALQSALTGSLRHAPGSGQPAPIDMVVWLRRRAASVLAGRRGMGVLLVAARPDQTLESIHAQVGGEFHKVKNDVFRLREWGFINEVDNPTGANPRALYLQADRASVLGVCELLSYLAAMQWDARAQISAAVQAQLANATAHSTPDDTAAIANSVEKLLATDGRDLLDRWSALVGFLAEVNVQRLIAEPGEWTLADAVRVTGLTPRSAKAVVNQMVRYGLLLGTEVSSLPDAPGQTWKSPLPSPLIAIIDGLAEPVTKTIIRSTDPWALASVIANHSRRQILHRLASVDKPQIVRELVDATNVTWMSGHLSILARTRLIEEVPVGVTTRCCLTADTGVIQSLERVLAAEENVPVYSPEPHYFVRVLRSLGAREIALALLAADSTGLHESACLAAAGASSSPDDTAIGRGILDEFEATGLAEVERPSPTRTAWRYRLSSVGIKLVGRVRLLGGISPSPLADVDVLHLLCIDLAAPERCLAALYTAWCRKTASSADIDKATGVDPMPIYEMRILCATSPAKLGGTGLRFDAHPSTVQPLMRLVTTIARQTRDRTRNETMAAIELFMSETAPTRALRNLSKAFGDDLGLVWRRVFSTMARSPGRTALLAAMAEAADKPVPVAPGHRALSDVGLCEVTEDHARISNLGSAVFENLSALLHPAALTNSGASTEIARIGQVIAALDDNLSVDILLLALGQKILTINDVMSALDVPKGAAGYHVARLRATSLLIDAPAPTARPVTQPKEYTVNPSGRSALTSIIAMVSPAGLHIDPRRSPTVQ